MNILKRIDEINTTKRPIQALHRPSPTLKRPTNGMHLPPRNPPERIPPHTRPTLHLISARRHHTVHPLLLLLTAIIAHPATMNVPTTVKTAFCLLSSLSRPRLTGRYGGTRRNVPAGQPSGFVAAYGSGCGARVGLKAAGCGSRDVPVEDGG